jgi:hypothetical protein
MFTIEVLFLKNKMVMKEKETIHNLKTDHLLLIPRGTPPEFRPIRLKFGSTTAHTIYIRCTEWHDASVQIQRDGEGICTLPRVLGW